MPAATAVFAGWPLPADVVERLSTPVRVGVDRTRTTFSRPADLPGVEILRVDESERLWRAYHADYSVCTVVASGGGVAEWSYRRGHYETSAGGMMLVEPGEVHSTNRITAAGSFYVASFSPALIADFARTAGLGSRPHIATPSCARPEIFRAFVGFHVAQADGASLLERQSRLNRCIGLMLAHCCEAPLRKPAKPARLALLRARDYLQTHWTENVSLDCLAEIAGLSRFHFLCAFEDEFMLPPHAYLVMVRIEKVRHLLRNGVPTAAIEAGFSDQSHLIRHFRRTWGVTPAQYATMVGASTARLRRL